MSDTLRLWRTLVCAAVGIASVGLVPGCGGKKSTAPAGGELVISPTVVLGDTSNYQVESAWIGASRSTSHFVYGVVKIKYLGTADQRSVRVQATFKDKKARKIFDDESYIDNPDMCSIGAGVNSNAFLTPARDTGYYFIIDDLSDYGAAVSDITRLELTITGEDYEYLPPSGHLGQQGAPYRDKPDAWSLDVKNDGDVTVEAEYTQFVFEDDQGRVFKWTYPDCYVGGSESWLFAVGATGSYVAEDVSPDYLDEPLDFAAALLDWRVLSPGKPAAARSTSWRGLPVDERTQLMREERNRLEDAKRLMR